MTNTLNPTYEEEVGTVNQTNKLPRAAKAYATYLWEVTLVRRDAQTDDIQLTG